MADLHAVIFADRPGTALAPLTDHTCAALLPVADKPMLVHAIEAVAAAGIATADIVAGPDADAVRRVVGDGTRWGIRADVTLRAGAETPDAVVARLRGRCPGDVLVLRGDVLCAASLAQFLQAADAVAAESVAATSGGVPAGVRLVRAGAAAALHLLGDPEDETHWRETGPTVELADATVSRCESLAAYHRVNLDAAAGRCPHLLLACREIAPGIRLGARAHIAAGTAPTAPLFVGAHSELKRGAEVLGEVMVSHDVVIDRRATLRRAVVLPHTYVGELVAVEDAIVNGDCLIDVTSGAVTHVFDAFLLADLRGAATGGRLQRGLDRLLGAVLLALSLPLWPVAFAAALARDPRAPVRRVFLFGNRIEAGAGGRPHRVRFAAWEFAARAPVLRYLPRLCAVLSGDLRPVGVTPLGDPEGIVVRTPWEQVRDRAPVGLIGPAQITLTSDAPDEERGLAEAYYARTRSAARDLMLLCRGATALCSRRAWHAGVATS